MAGGDPILEMRNVEKSFGVVNVLKNVDFTLARGEVHALMGGNGAGKSTLMKILTGVYTMDSGTIAIDGSPVHIHGANSAKRAGIAMIFQEFSLVPTLTVAQNIFLNREPRAGSLFLNDRASAKKARAILDDLGETLPVNTPVSELSAGMMQMVEIAKALSQNAKILIMDEPTASLSEHETETLFKIVRRLKASGISIIYISHRMAEIFELCDRVTVMRDGEAKLTHDCADLTIPELVDSMLGTSSAAAFAWHDRHVEARGEPVLSVSHLRLPPRVDDVSFDVHAGEIVGLAGLMGSGRTEIAEAIFGRRTPAGGEVTVGGRRITGQEQAIAAGVALVPEDRRRMGLVLDHSVQSNIMLPNLDVFSRGPFVTDLDASGVVRQMIARLRIKTESPSKVARLLSGGNQQKIVLSKWLARQPRLLILDEPTIGVDIGAKGEIATQIRELADAGAAILVISSELEELLVVSDRLLILHDGHIVQNIQRRDVKTEEELHHAVQGHLIADTDHAGDSARDHADEGHVGSSLAVLQDNIVYIFFAIVILFFALTIGDEGFLTVTNMFNITRTTAMISIVAFAMTFVIACGELDLSVGSISALSALTCAMVIQGGYPWWLGVICALLSGVVVGCFNGFFVTYVRIPSFLVTLGMLQLIRGVDMRVTYTNPVPIMSHTFNGLFGHGKFYGIPSLLIWSVVFAIIGHVALRYTTFGRRILATGGNRLAAEYSGVKTSRIKFYGFLLTGLAAALAGMLYSGMMQTARYNYGDGVELQAIASVILGGTSLFGGRASIIGTFAGALMIGTINNGLIIMGLDVSEQMIIAGAIIILAVAFARKPAR